MRLSISVSFRWLDVGVYSADLRRSLSVAIRPLIPAMFHTLKKVYGSPVRTNGTRDSENRKMCNCKVLDNKTRV